MSENGRLGGAPGPKLAEGREAEIFAWDETTVLRLFRRGRSAETLAREAAAMTAARAAGPIAPAVRGTIEVDGRQGLLIERVDGPDLFATIARRPWTVWGAGRTLGAIQARLHEMPATSLRSTKERLARNLAARETLPASLLRTALSTLDDLPDGDRLCHGDLHPGNILMAHSGPVVIDWPNATRGDPTADVARTLTLLRVGALPPEAPRTVRLGDRFLRRSLQTAHLRAYRRARGLDGALLDRWLVVALVDRLAEAIPGEREVILVRLNALGVR
jgi:aminoglycoside phosphotransferase (APT) family kinase protein